MRRVIWAPAARNDLLSIRNYIKDFNPMAARQLAALLVEAAQSLAEFAERGRNRGRNRRELVIVPPYVIRYRIKGDVVEIIRIRHGSRKPTH